MATITDPTPMTQLTWDAKRASYVGEMSATNGLSYTEGGIAFITLDCDGAEATFVAYRVERDADGDLTLMRFRPLDDDAERIAYNVVLFND
jgi:hypothetical protein